MKEKKKNRERKNKRQEGKCSENERERQKEKSHIDTQNDFGPLQQEEEEEETDTQTNRFLPGKAETNAKSTFSSTGNMVKSPNNSCISLVPMGVDKLIVSFSTSPIFMYFC